ncbi:MAG: LacI family transcriptional regulator [Planctomycetota bacterium]|jgi:LacI family transcriptional regulator|nr:LacI family transcriptional regulator [Planctomycetota bacterium]
MTPSTGNITIRDVARYAKVSVATVSRVVNGNYPVSRETAARVNAAIRALDFTPHILASGLKTGNSRMIGVIASSIINPTIMRMIKGVESILEKSNYLMTISSTDNDVGKEARLLRFFQERLVAAVIDITAATRADIFESIRKRGIPLVLLDRGIADSDIDAVLGNNFDATYAMTERIIEKGHRRILVLKGKNISTGTERYRGFLAAMRDHKLPIDRNLHLRGNFDRACARRQVLKFFAGPGRGGRPSVILAFNQLMTEGAMEALYELGMNIPGDMSIVSYDTVGMSPPVFKPVIACISQNSYRMGQQAGKLALRRLSEREAAGRGKSVQVTVESELLEGDSLLDIN